MKVRNGTLTRGGGIRGPSRLRGRRGWEGDGWGGRPRVEPLRPENYEEFSVGLIPPGNGEFSFQVENHLKSQTP